MENVLSSKRKSTKKVMGLTDKEKVDSLLEYLHMTPIEFSNEFRIVKGVMSGLLDGSSRLTNKVKVRIINRYPEISKIWMEYGTGFMTSGLVPNHRLINIFEEIYEVKVNDVSELTSEIAHLSTITNIKIDKIADLLDLNRQLTFNDSLRFAREFKVKYYDILSEDKNLELDLDKSVIESIRESYKSSKDVLINDIEIESEIKVSDKFKSPIYIYLKDKIDNKYLTTYEFSKVTGIQVERVWYMFTHRKTLDNYMARELCDKFSLNYDDLVDNNLVNLNNTRSSNRCSTKFSGPIYEALKGYIDGMSIQDISCVTGLSISAVKGHLYGRYSGIKKDTAKVYINALKIKPELLEPLILDSENGKLLDMKSIATRLSSDRLRYYIMSLPSLSRELLEVLMRRYTLIDDSTLSIRLDGRYLNISKEIDSRNVLILKCGSRTLLELPKSYLDPSVNPRNLIVKIARENLSALGYEIKEAVEKG